MTDLDKSLSVSVALFAMSRGASLWDAKAVAQSVLSRVSQDPSMSLDLVLDVVVQEMGRHGFNVG